MVRHYFIWSPFVPHQPNISQINSPWLKGPQTLNIIIIIKLQIHIQITIGESHEFCFAIPIYPRLNLWINCTSSYLSLLLPSMSLRPILFSKWAIKRNFSLQALLSSPVVRMSWTCPNHHKWISQNLSPIDVTSKHSLRRISYYIFPRFFTHPSQHSYPLLHSFLHVSVY